MLFIIKLKCNSVLLNTRLIFSICTALEIQNSANGVRNSKIQTPNGVIYLDGTHEVAEKRKIHILQKLTSGN